MNTIIGECGGCFDESCWVTVRTSFGELVRTNLCDIKNNGKQFFARILCIV